MGDGMPVVEPSEPTHRYEATIRVVIEAPGLDAAYRAQQEVTHKARTTADHRVVAVHSSMLDLHHKPDAR